MMLPLACASTIWAVENPVEGLSFAAQISSLEYPGTPYSPGYRASQRISDPEHFRTGVVVVTLHHDTDISNIAWCVVLGRVVQGQVTLLDRKKDFAVHMFDSKTPRLAILPYQGWRYGGEYVLRFLDSARYRDGRPLADPRAEWVITIPVEASPFHDKPPRRTSSPAPLKTVASINPFPGGRPWDLKYTNQGEPVLVAAEGVNRHVQFEYGPYGRITSRNEVPFSYDASGRRAEDDRYKYTWDWRSRLYVVTVKDEWPGEDGDIITPAYAGHRVQYEYDALGRLLWRKHFGADGGLAERRDFIWEQQCLVAEIAFTDESRTALRWRKTYVAGPSGLDDQVQVHVESFPSSDPEEPIDKVFTYLRDKTGTVIALIEEVPGADPAQPPSAVVRYLYTPYGEVTAMGGPAALNPLQYFPGEQNLLFQGLWTDMVTGMAYARARWYDPRNTHFLSEDPAGNVDSENLYMFVAGKPHVFVDPLGMTSRTDVKNDRMFYTWNFGWVDLSHAREYPGLAPAWRALQKAEPGEVVPVSLQMIQKDPGHPFYKESDFSLAITAAETETERKRQLLYAFQQLSEDFEEYQGTGLQGSQLFNTVGGILTGEEQKIASSFSTEDLFSNLIAFHATVNGTSVNSLVNEFGGSTTDIEARRELSLLVWDYLLTPEKGGQTEWAPVYLDPSDLPTTKEVLDRVLPTVGSREDLMVREQLRGIIEGDLKRLQELLLEYQKQGEPALPEELTLQPLAEGVSITDVVHR